ncbi:MAG: 50S ribosomal protein L6, partial [Lentisphaerae bacterium]|nr:50S ribosomal protein L6 [Lentisphaerota bacterium]
MSRVGQQPVTLLPGVEVKVSGSTVSAKGPKGGMALQIPGGLAVKVDGGKVKVDRQNELKFTRSLHGLMRSLIHNMV